MLAKRQCQVVTFIYTFRLHKFAVNSAMVDIQGSLFDIQGVPEINTGKNAISSTILHSHTNLW